MQFQLFLFRKARSVINVTVFLLTAILCISDLAAQNAPAKVVAGIPVNYDESLAGSYTLPELPFHNAGMVRPLII
jgi:hypothetical protein